jgi:hypothetical protein
MQTFIDPVQFCRYVTDCAAEQGWELNLQQVDVPMRWVWTWTWKGLHPLPRQERLFPGRADALFCACLDLVAQTGWPMQFEYPAPDPMELLKVTGLGRAVA